MSEAPQDIVDTASEEALFFACWLNAGNSTGHLSKHAIEGLADSFQKALIKERERCLAIVEKDRRSQMAKEFNYIPNFVNIQAAISAEIRNSK